MYTSTVLTLGSLATIVSATALDKAFARREFEFPVTVPMHKRAVTGAEYQCHANCGYTILDAEDDGYCDSDDWLELLEACLECANTYDMWGDYGDGVEAAAEACGLSAVPSASGSSDSTTAAETTAAAATTTAAAAETTEAAAETTEAAAETTEAAAETTEAAAETTAAAEETTAVEETQAEETVAATSSAAATSAPYSTTYVSTTPTGSNGTSSTPTSSVVQAGAPEFAVSHVVAAGAAVLAIAGLM